MIEKPLVIWNPTPSGVGAVSPIIITNSADYDSIKYLKSGNIERMEELLEVVAKSE